MKNVLKTLNEFGQEITIEIILSFIIEELNKEYVVYTINDDGISNDVNIIISEIEYINNIPKIKSIPEEEKEMVILFYNNVKKSIVDFKQ